MSAFLVYMFTLGLATSLHCVTMCGPLVLTYALKSHQDGPWYRRVTPNAAYQGAKIASYMLVGLLLGAIGGFFDLDAIRPYVMFLAGAFMIVLGLGMTERVKWAQKLTPRAPAWLMRALSRTRKKSVAEADAGTSSLATPITLGLLTGLLPCGPLMAAEVAAAASGSAASGALGMVAFGVGTAPLMVAFGTAGTLVPGVWKQRMMTVLAVGVILFGFAFINRGLMLTGSPVTFNSLRNSVAGAFTGADSNTEQYTRASDGVVEVPLAIVDVDYVPSTVHIPADTPVRLVVDRQEDVPCSDQFALPQLGVLVDLTPNGVTNVDVPSAPAGTYTMTCGMGMMSGQLVVGESSATSRSKLPVLWVGVALVAVTGAVWAAFRHTRTA